MPGLGVLPGMVRLPPDGVKRPQMQWNVLDRRRGRVVGRLPEPRGSTSCTRTPRTAPSTRGHVRLRRAGGGRGRGRVRCGPRSSTPRSRGPRACASSPTSSAGRRVGGRGVTARSQEPVMDLYPAIDLRDGRWCGCTRATTPGRPCTATTPSPRRGLRRGRRDLGPRRRSRRRSHRRPANRESWRPWPCRRCAGPVRRWRPQRCRRRWAAGAGRAPVVVGTAALEGPTGSIAGRPLPGTGGGRARRPGPRRGRAGLGPGLGPRPRRGRPPVRGRRRGGVRRHRDREGWHALRSGLDQLAAVLEATCVDLIASGGVGTLADLRTLSVLEVDGRRLAGTIVGRALYEGAVRPVATSRRRRP